METSDQDFSNNHKVFSALQELDRNLIKTESKQASPELEDSTSPVDTKEAFKSNPKSTTDKVKLRFEERRKTSFMSPIQHGINKNEESLSPQTTHLGQRLDNCEQLFNSFINHPETQSKARVILETPSRQTNYQTNPQNQSKSQKKLIKASERQEEISATSSRNNEASFTFKSSGQQEYYNSQRGDLPSPADLQKDLLDSGCFLHTTPKQRRHKNPRTDQQQQQSVQLYESAYLKATPPARSQQESKETNKLRSQQKLKEFIRRNNLDIQEQYKNVELAIQEVSLQMSRAIETSDRIFQEAMGMSLGGKTSETLCLQASGNQGEGLGLGSGKNSSTKRYMAKTSQITHIKVEERFGQDSGNSRIKNAPQHGGVPRIARESNLSFPHDQLTIKTKSHSEKSSIEPSSTSGDRYYISPEVQDSPAPADYPGVYRMPHNSNCKDFDSLDSQSQRIDEVAEEYSCNRKSDTREDVKNQFDQEIGPFCREDCLNFDHNFQEIFQEGVILSNRKRSNGSRRSCGVLAGRKNSEKELNSTAGVSRGLAINKEGSERTGALEGSQGMQSASKTPNFKILETPKSGFRDKHPDTRMFLKSDKPSNLRLEKESERPLVYDLNVGGDLEKKAKVFDFKRIEISERDPRLAPLNTSFIRGLHDSGDHIRGPKQKDKPEEEEFKRKNQKEQADETDLQDSLKSTKNPLKIMPKSQPLTPSATPNEVTLHPPPSLDNNNYRARGGQRDQKIVETPPQQPKNKKSSKKSSLSKYLEILDQELTKVDGKIGSIRDILDVSDLTGEFLPSNQPGTNPLESNNALKGSMAYPPDNSVDLKMQLLYQEYYKISQKGQKMKKKVEAKRTNFVAQLKEIGAQRLEKGGETLGISLDKLGIEPLNPNRPLYDENGFRPTEDQIRGNSKEERDKLNYSKVFSYKHSDPGPRNPAIIEKTQKTICKKDLSQIFEVSEANTSRAHTKEDGDESNLLKSKQTPQNLKKKGKASKTKKQNQMGDMVIEGNRVVMKEHEFNQFVRQKKKFLKNCSKENFSPDRYRVRKNPPKMYKRASKGSRMRLKSPRSPKSPEKVSKFEKVYSRKMGKINRTGSLGKPETTRKRKTTPNKRPKDPKLQKDSSKKRWNYHLKFDEKLTKSPSKTSQPPKKRRFQRKGSPDYERINQIYKNSFFRNKQKELEKEKRIKLKEEKEISECTFSPRINKVNSYNDTEFAKMPFKKRQEIWLHNKEEKMNNLHRRIKKTRKMQCTFQPQLKSRVLDAGEWPGSLDQKGLGRGSGGLESDYGGSRSRSQSPIICYKQNSGCR